MPADRPAQKEAAEYGAEMDARGLAVADREEALKLDRIAAAFHEC